MRWRLPLTIVALLLAVSVLGLTVVLGIDLQARDIELVLKPQLWLRDDSKGWLQDLSFGQGPAWER